VSEQRPIEIAVIDGGYGTITAAFELTTPQHRGKYHVPLYQLASVLGEKGVSGRGSADRVEGHGFRLGFYEHASRFLREYHIELNREPKKRCFTGGTIPFHLKLLRESNSDEPYSQNPNCR
jgi:uncharacterized protein with NAD-binding domain and iron-sulfur cluster